MSTHFPDDVTETLRCAGWEPEQHDAQQAHTWSEQLSAYRGADGHRHTVHPAAVQVWARFGGLSVRVGGPGEEQARTGFRIDPLIGLHLPRTFVDFGRALGTDVCPLGEESTGNALLAIDAWARVHSLDHTGEWLLGVDIAEAISTLLLGRIPRRLTPRQSALSVDAPADVVETRDPGDPENPRAPEGSEGS